MDQPEAPEHRLGPGNATPRARPNPSNDPEPIEVKPASSSPEPMPDDASIQPFGAMLAPVLVQMCAGRLSSINWFRTDWQRGGALTGYATWHDDHGLEHPAVVKLPIPPRERRWLVQLSNDDVTPRVLAHGTELGGYDLCWVVMERLPHGPLGRPWGSGACELLADAAANFYACARLIPLNDPPKHRDWKEQLKRARACLGRDTIAQSQRWRQVLKAVGKKLPKWLDIWRARDTGYWCHGDLHLGNAMSRYPAPDGPAVLFDLAAVHRGHWVEDAIYLEHLYWANPQALGPTPPDKLIARTLRDYDLAPGENWPELANIYRALLAMVAPAHLNAQGGSTHAAAALEVLEGLL